MIALILDNDICLWDKSQKITAVRLKIAIDKKVKIKNTHYIFYLMFKSRQSVSVAITLVHHETSF